jgi:hypothetical protein
MCCVSCPTNPTCAVSTYCSWDRTFRIYRGGSAESTSWLIRSTYKMLLQMVKLINAVRMSTPVALGCHREH